MKSYAAGVVLMVQGLEGIDLVLLPFRMRGLAPRLRAWETALGAPPGDDEWRWEEDHPDPRISVLHGPGCWLTVGARTAALHLLFGAAVEGDATVEEALLAVAEGVGRILGSDRAVFLREGELEEQVEDLVAHGRTLEAVERWLRRRVGKPMLRFADLRGDRRFLVHEFDPPAP